MALPKDNRVILAVGAGVVIVAAVVLALIFTGGGDKPTEAPPASKGGLVVNLAEAPSLEPTRELRCFVDGQFVGMATLADCARRNGLATDALDVGLDSTGALAAAPTAAFAPPVEDEHLYRVVDALDAIAAETGKTAPQIAINWLLQRPTVASVIVGARNEQQLRQNLGAVGWSLTPDQIASLDAASDVLPPYPHTPYRQQEGFARLNPPLV